MISLTASPFNLVQGSQIYVTISASNLFGTSVSTSNVFGGLLQVTPSPPVLYNNLAITNSAVIGLQWVTIQNGGSAIIDYRLEFRIAGSINFTLISSNLTVTTYQTTMTLMPNTVYEFIIMSRNTVGYSSYSNIV